MNSPLATLITSGFKNWKTTLAGLLIALATVFQNGGFEGLSGQELTFAIGSVVMGYLARDANKSSQDSGVRRVILMLLLPAFFLTGCALNPEQQRALLTMAAGSLARRGHISLEDAEDIRYGSKIIFTSAKEPRDVTP
jgi:hypothetical protein